MDEYLLRCRVQNKMRGESLTKEQYVKKSIKELVNGERDSVFNGKDDGLTRSMIKSINNRIMGR